MANTLDVPKFLELVLNFGRTSRFTQDTPILPEVWVTYASEPLGEEPNESGSKRLPLLRHDLILTPFFGSTAFDAADAICESLKARNTLKSSRLAALRADVGVALTFEELIEDVLPHTLWWVRRLIEPFFTNPETARKIGKVEEYLPYLISNFLNQKTRYLHEALDQESDQALWYFIILTAIVTYLNQPRTERARSTAFRKINILVDDIVQRRAKVSDLKTIWTLETRELLSNLSMTLASAIEHTSQLLRDKLIVDVRWVERPEAGFTKIWAINLNRPISLSLNLSRLAVKADASERVFDHDARHIVWAVMDSGIDATHPAFARRERDGSIRKDYWDDKEMGRVKPRYSRVGRTFDFLLLRDIAAFRWMGASQELRERIKQVGITDTELGDASDGIERRLKLGRELDWEVITPLIEVPHDAETYISGRDGQGFIPKHPHGTHVAGIIGGDLRVDHDQDMVAELTSDTRGVCPSIQLFDLRVCDDKGRGDEFVVLAALQFISHLNRDRDLMRVHGVNISLSLKHMVANFACGQTPVCQECVRVLGDRVVVVTAAGNTGYLRLQGENGITEAYNSISITDPGNAQEVITVGSTHRERPHAYGVSYFSSRGPTADGRYKPDILAPGEKIWSAIPGPKVQAMDGTSMAAPHVSGAAATLMARHTELKGDPQRIKQILCETATDLGRDRYFQGAGLLDILRALQSV